MNPFRSALRKKRFQGLKVEIEPMEAGQEQEEMARAAAAGDAAPEVMDDEQPEGEMVALGQMASEEPEEEAEFPPIADDEAQEFVQRAQQTPGIQDLSEEEVFGTSPSFKGPGKTLRDKARANMRKK